MVLWPLLFCCWLCRGGDRLGGGTGCRWEKLSPLPGTLGADADGLIGIFPLEAVVVSGPPRTDEVVT